ncbi:hypothetical protein [Nonomuraea sp. NPDC005692]|uniref:hypothetical protein n=1 Tax=Nonomuraea sp. NPDC005692 TaxID=3157168 RepID=UPI0033EB66A7
MIAAIARIQTLSAAFGYAAAVLTLTWLTQDGRLGDGTYGDLAMVVMAFPLYLAAGPLNGALHAYAPGPPHAWDLVLMAWPGIVLAILLASLRGRAAGRVLGWLSAAAVTLVGVATTFDGWAPRRPYGWPFLVCGLIMIVGLMTARRPAPDVRHGPGPRPPGP